MKVYIFVEIAMILVATARTSITEATIFSLKVEKPFTFRRTIAAGKMNAIETVEVDPKN